MLNTTGAQEAPRRSKKMTNKTDWIALYYADRQNMAAIMRENIATEVKYGRGSVWAFRELEKVMEYEKETEEKMKVFLSAWNGQSLAYYDMKKRGAIA